jgi:hypothetical protein
MHVTVQLYILSYFRCNVFYSLLKVKYLLSLWNRFLLEVLSHLATQGILQPFMELGRFDIVFIKAFQCANVSGFINPMEFWNNWIVDCVLCVMFDVDDRVLYYELSNFSSQTIIVQTLCNWTWLVPYPLVSTCTWICGM